MIHADARDAGIEPADLDRWTAEPKAQDALSEGIVIARDRMAAARVLDAKLANWWAGRLHVPVPTRSCAPSTAPASRCPASSLPVLRRRHRQPHVRRRPPRGARRRGRGLRWSGTALASKEVAVVCDISVQDACEALDQVADEEHVGLDGFWTLNWV
jgi:hypothetical protein